MGFHRQASLLVCLSKDKASPKGSSDFVPGTLNSQWRPVPRNQEFTLWKIK